MDVNNTVNVESSDRGLSPHQFMPMLGVHPAFNADVRPHKYVAVFVVDSYIYRSYIKEC